MKRTVFISLMMVVLAGCGSGLDMPVETFGSGASGGPAMSTPAQESGASSAAVGSIPAGTPGFDAFPYLPDPRLSPGAVLDVTADDICVTGYSSKVRNVPQSEKDQVYKEYGILSHAPRSYEVDHLISLELGGSNSISNLWPESYSGAWNAHVKDRLENKLHAMVCDGSLDLKTAQQEIAGNWIAAYRKYIGEP